MNDFKQYTKEQLEEKVIKLQKSINLISRNVIYSRTDRKGRIIEASDAFCEISQYSREELLGKPHNIIRHPDVPSSLYKDMWNTIKSGKEWSGEIHNKKKDGSSYWVTTTISPEYDDESNIKSYMAIRHDITAEIKLKIGLNIKNWGLKT